MLARIYQPARSAMQSGQSKRDWMLEFAPAEAKRIDVVTTGGRYVEPVYGRPRRVQGTVIAIEDGAVVVNAGACNRCQLCDLRCPDFAITVR